MTYTQASIDDVKRATSLEALVRGHGVALTKSGPHTFLCACPFHQEVTPSLSIDVAQQVWHCHGCGAGGGVVEFEQRITGAPFGEVIERLAAHAGVALVEEPKGPPRLVASYRYTDVAGDLLYVIERWEPGERGRSKTFKQRLADGTHKKCARQVLYRWPEVAAALAAGRTVYVVEGEKCADRIAALGGCATTHAGGTGASEKTWTPEFAEALRGAVVVVLADNDEPGIKHARHVHSVIKGIAARAHILGANALGLTGKGDDVADWLDAGHTLDELAALRPQDETSSADPPNADEERLTDSGNAERWVTQHGENFRFATASGSWLAWDGTRWARDEGGRAMLATKTVARSWLDEVPREPDGRRRLELVKHATKSESKGARAAMLVLAASEPGMAVTPAQLDADAWALNVANGTIDLRTGKLRPHQQADLNTKVAPTAYDPAALAPTFAAFLESSLPDVDVRAFVQRLLGYGLTGVVHEHVLPVFWGSGGNGKGTLVETVRAVLGDYAQAVPADLLMARQGESHPTERASLLGLRLAFASETGRGQALSEATVKLLTGGDSISARFMREDFFTFAPTHKLVLQTNHKPVVKGTDRGIWRRVRLVPWTVVPAHPDIHLKDKLAAERPGILRWLVEGCLAWQRDGLGTATAVDDATAAYREESDVIGDFLDESCVLARDARTKAGSLYAAYQAWAEAHGEHAWTQRRFGEALSERGLERRKSDGTKIYLGIGLRAGTEGPSGTDSGFVSRGEISKGGIRNSVSDRPSVPVQQKLYQETPREGEPDDYFVEPEWGGE